MTAPAHSSFAASTFDKAVTAWRAGANDAALAACEQLLAVDPQHFDALHLAGMIQLRRDRAAARALFERALALREAPDILVSFALACDGTDPAQAAQAHAALQRALELDPHQADALNNFANLHAARGDFATAIALFERLIAERPGNAIAHYNYGSLLLTSGQNARAVAPLVRAIELEPAHVSAHVNLGNVLIALNRLDEALAVLAAARTLDPDASDVLTNLGCVQRLLGRHDEARAQLERAVALAPGNASAWNNLGNVFYDLGHIDESQAASLRAIELRPNFADAHCNLGNALKSMGDVEPALAAYRGALACDPDHRGAGGNLVYMLAFATENGAEIRTQAEAFAARHEAPLLAQPVSYANLRDPARRLRIGYVSPDFRNHCQSLFTLPLFAHHDRAAFEIVCYSTLTQPDAITAQLAAHVDRWRDARALTDAQLAQQIRDDGIDVLVDLTMYMANARREVFARRPAPVQVAWLAYPGTTGSRAIGWRLTDPWLDPPGVPGIDAQYTERSLRLPDTFWCYAPLDAPAEVGPLPALAAGHVTFGCLNNPCKITDATLALWSGVFAALPDARLVLMAPPGQARARLAGRLTAHGMDAARVSFVGFQPRDDYLRTWSRVDIALDTFPYNGHTTSLDAFWMGVPVPTRAGRSAASRAGLSLLANLGLPELVAHHNAHYARIVVELARDLPRLAALRAGLRARMAASPLMDAARFARGIEAAYRFMWLIAV
ncbi:tetratricopeptide repeat protein [Paraburkholderia sp. J76]|uniref:tetratricopeptide repeat protein n=1 Tax=Paraburkholderia sp. J76 TaxID=2805439 RepID=UPI002ABDA7A7|nr:tetratricopeptide repeat protein [Paraburkholderia sp. J76]